MNVAEMVAELDAEINRLTEARDALQALEGRTAGEPTGKRRGRPRKAVAVEAAPTETKPGRRTMSAEGKRRIAEAQRKRWAAQKRASKAASQPASAKIVRKAAPAKTTAKSAAKSASAKSAADARKTAPQKRTAAKVAPGNSPAKRKASPARAKSTAKPVTKAPANTARPVTKDPAKPKSSPAQPVSPAVANNREATVRAALASGTPPKAG